MVMHIPVIITELGATGEAHPKLFIIATDFTVCHFQWLLLETAEWTQGFVPL
jgi:hypothetical protein